MDIHVKNGGKIKYSIEKIKIKDILTIFLISSLMGILINNNNK